MVLEGDGSVVASEQSRPVLPWRALTEAAVEWTLNIEDLVFNGALRAGYFDGRHLGGTWPTREQRSASRCRKPAWRFRYNHWPACFFFLLVCMLAGLSWPVLSDRESYCKTFAGRGNCPVCVLNIDTCRPVDQYWDSTGFCIDPTSSDVPRCGNYTTFLMMPTGLNRTVAAAQLTIFQDTDDFLYLTFRLNCPYVLRPGITDSAGTFATPNVAVLVWNSTMATPQYAGGLTDLYSGTYTCLTAVIDLKHVCDPTCSQYLNVPLSARNYRCSTTVGQSCPPRDLSRERNLVILPSLTVWPAGPTCGPALENGLFNKFTANVSSGVIVWDALACGPRGTPPRTTSPSPPSPLPSPSLPPRPPAVSPSPPAPFLPPPPGPPAPPSPQPQAPSPGPPEVPRQPSPSPSPGVGSRDSGELPNSPSPPAPKMPPPPLPSPSPSPVPPPSPFPPVPTPPPPPPLPPSPTPPTPPPPPSPIPPSPLRPSPTPPTSPPPPTPSPRPAPSPKPRPSPSPKRSPSPTPAPSPLPAPSPSTAAPPNPIVIPGSPGPGGSNSSTASESSLPPGEHASQGPPLAESTPPPPEEAHHSSTKSWFSNAGIGLLVGLGSVGFAVMCCCSITIYVLCRRGSRAQMSESGDTAPPIMPCDNSTTGGDDDRSLSNFSFAMLPRTYDKDRQDSGGGCGASFSAGMTFGDMEKGGSSRLFPMTDGSGLSVSGESYRLSRPVSYQGDAPSSQVFVKLDNSPPHTPTDPRSLLNAHAAAAAAMGAQARHMAALGGAAVAASRAPRSTPAPATPPPATPPPLPAPPVAASPFAAATTADAGRKSSGGGGGAGPPHRGERFLELLQRQRGRFGRSPRPPAAISATARLADDCQSVDLLPLSPTEAEAAPADARAAGSPGDSSTNASSGGVPAQGLALPGAGAAAAAAAQLQQQSPAPAAAPLTLFQQIRRSGLLRTAAAAASLYQLGSGGGPGDRQPSMASLSSAASLSPASSLGLAVRPSLLQRLSTLRGGNSLCSIPSSAAGGASASSSAAAAGAPGRGRGSSSGSTAAAATITTASGGGAAVRGSSSSLSGFGSGSFGFSTAAAILGSGSSANDSHSSNNNLYPSVLAVPPSANPAATLAAANANASSSTGTSAGGVGAGGGASAGGSNPYPSLFHGAELTPSGAVVLPPPPPSLLSPTHSVSPTSGSRRPPPLATIPSMGPLILPESTFATYAPIDLDAEDEEAAAGATKLPALLAPYGSANAAPALLSPNSTDVTTTSSSASSAVTLYSPSLRTHGSNGLGGAASSSIGSGRDGPSLARGGSASCGGGSAAASVAGGRVSSLGGAASGGTPSPFSHAVGAATHAAAAAGGADGPRRAVSNPLSPAQSPPRSPPKASDGDGTFTFRSAGGSPSAGDRPTPLAAASSLPLGGRSPGDLPAGSPFRRGASSTSIVGAGGAGGTTAASSAAAGGPDTTAARLGGAGAAAAAAAAAAGGRGGSPLRNASSVGCAPGTRLPLPPLPSVLSLAATAAAVGGGSAGGSSSHSTAPSSASASRGGTSEIVPLAGPPPPLSPPPALAGRVPVSGSPQRGSGMMLAPPPPMHTQPLTGPHGSILQTPLPLALRPRQSLPAPAGSAAAAAAAGFLPAPPPGTAGSNHGTPGGLLGSRSSSPVNLSPTRLPPGQPYASPVNGSGRSSPSLSPPSASPPQCSSPLRHAHSSGLPLASAPSVTSSPSGSPISASAGRQPSIHVSNSTASRGGIATPTASGGSVSTAGGSTRIRSVGSLPAAQSIAGNSSVGGSPRSGSVASWGTNAVPYLDLDSIRRYCTAGAATAAAGGANAGDGETVVGNGFRGLAALAGGCDGGGEELPLSGVPVGDGLTALYAAVCQLQPGTKYFNKYKIRDSPILGRHAVVVLAKNVWSKARVAIKFHADRRQYEREKALLRALSSAHVPAMEEPLEGPAVEALGLPPALVMEAGRCTLTEWLRGDGGVPRDMLALKTALHQILAALMHLHQHRVVHRDIKPANIMWFEDAHRFKLVDLAESAYVGEAAPPCCTPLYSAPEQLKAALEGTPSAAVVTTAADMWSFGVVAFEVLSGGSRFYGPCPQLSEVLEAVFGHRPLPSEGEHSALAGFDLSQARRLIQHLVVRSPAGRWSAATCHRNALFASGDDTDQRAAKWDSMLSRITEVQQVVAITTAEVRTAQMAINFVICEGEPAAPGASGGSGFAAGFDRTYSSASGYSSAASSRGGTPPRLHHMDSSRISRQLVYKAVPMMADDCLPSEPIYMLLLHKAYQIRISVAHAKGLKLDIEHIEHLKLTTPDNKVQLLPVRLDTGLRDGGVEYVAEWDPSASQSKHLLSVTATEGPIQRRVVFLNAELVVHLSGIQQPMTVNAMLYVVVERKSFRYTMAKFKLWSSDRWSQAPQWMRDVAKGTMVLVRVAGNVVGV